MATICNKNKSTKKKYKTKEENLLKNGIENDKIFITNEIKLEMIFIVSKIYYK